MLIKGNEHEPSKAASMLLALGIGVLMGALIAPRMGIWLRQITTTQSAEEAAAIRKPDKLPPPQPLPASNELAALQLSFTAADWQVLTDARNRALELGMIVQSPDDIVSVSLTLGRESATGKARLKGDWTDHIDTDQWSLRFELDQPIRGMRRFSIQNPKTRGFVMEWLVTQTALREGVLTPRSDYVQVTINGASKGTYYLEEHFSKELLEAQSRREGPIVRFDESAMWDTWLQHGFHKTGVLSKELWPATSFQYADVNGFGEGVLLKNSSLNARLQRALDQARDLQRIAINEFRNRPLSRLQALTALEGKTIEDLFVVDKLGKWLAIYTLYGGEHGLAWHQYRFYHDPVLDRLEPIVFDTGATFLSNPAELTLSSPDARWFRSSDAVIAAAYEQLGRMTEPSWSAKLSQDLGPKIRLIDAAIKKDLNLPMLDQLPAPDLVLQQRAAVMNKIVRPVVAASFATEVFDARLPDGLITQTIEVDARAMTAVSTQVSGFRFGNGRVVSAAAALVGLAGVDASAAAVSGWRDGAVLLPRDGTQVRFRFPVDRRLEGLSQVQAIKRAIKQQLQRDTKAPIEIEVLYRPLAETKDRVAPLTLRPSVATNQTPEGRPKSPTLAEALQRHAFLSYDFEQGRLEVQPGRHEVVGDLVTPAHMTLHFEAGTELVLQEGAVVLCASIVAEGTAEQPIRLIPKDPATGFAGLQVIGGNAVSTLRFLQVEHATAIDRGGWQSSGGVTFYRSPVNCYDCTFRGATCEDAFNLFAARCHFERCIFDGGPHDLFDGDFVDGDIVDCQFLNSGEDAVDVSGSSLTISNCVFTRIGDKALSIGEKSTVTALGSHIVSAAIAAASKDRSTLTLNNTTVDHVDHFVLTAYIKKPEFGAATIIANDLRYTAGIPAKHLAQTSCAITIDGTKVPTKDIDVGALYKQGILGK